MRWLHYRGQPDNPQVARVHGQPLCGAQVLVSSTFGHSEMTEVIDSVTCPDCIMRLLAFLHRDTAVLLRSLAGAVVSLQNASKVQGNG